MAPGGRNLRAEKIQPKGFGVWSVYQFLLKKAQRYNHPSPLLDQGGGRLAPEEKSKHRFFTSFRMTRQLGFVILRSGARDEGSMFFYIASSRQAG